MYKWFYTQFSKDRGLAPERIIKHHFPGYETLLDKLCQLKWWEGWTMGFIAASCLVTLLSVIVHHIFFCS